MTREAPVALVTNDDGITSPGLLALATALTEDFNVVAAAPAEDRSGSGTGIGRFDIEAGVALTPVELNGFGSAFSIDGPPGLAVTAAALGAFGPAPDLVVSGINAGINTGHSIIHSGTVGAALTAHTFRIRALAVSLAQSDPWHWDTAAFYAASAARWLISETRHPVVLNLNVPGMSRDDVTGVRWADLDECGYIRVATADFEGRRLEFVVGSRDGISDPASDTVLCLEGNVTLTPLATVEPAPFPDVTADEVCGAASIVHRAAGPP